MLDRNPQRCYHADTASEPDDKPERLRVSRKESQHMSIEFFKLPAALKKAIWAAYLAEWKKKQAAKKPATH